jgi:uncharacterized damage-inducible protein DinB
MKNVLVAVNKNLNAVVVESIKSMERPLIVEYSPYFQYYIDLVQEGDFFNLFQENTNTVLDFFSLFSEAQLDSKYQEGKWTIKQVLMHIIDTERVLSYRAFVGLRKDDSTLLQAFDDDTYADEAKGNLRTITSLLEEFKLLRRTTELLFENSNESQQQFKANAVDNCITPRAIGFIVIGHALHHLKIIQERYL